jgi:tRNA uridine 5-carbamoylmethylation protein Kti12
MGLVIALRAIPGSGKSTFAKQLIERLSTGGQSVEVFSADDYFYELGKGEYKFDFTHLPLAHGQCFRKFIEALQKGVDAVIVDNTNLSAWEISPYQLGAEAFGYDFKIKEIKADPEEAYQRQSHGVPQPAFEAMQGRFEKEWIPPWWRKETHESKTREGEPVFPRHLPPKEPEQLKLLEKDQREVIKKMASLFSEYLK